MSNLYTNIAPVANLYKKASIKSEVVTQIIFGERYKQFFIKNYLVQFLTNKLPYVEQDAAVFDLQQGIADKAQKIMGNQ